MAYSDEQLMGAVAASRSWRGTARALGLKGTSAGTIRALKRRADRLGLSTSHFTGQRTWSDRALSEAIATSDTWVEAIGKLGVSVDGTTRISVKGHAVRLGLDVRHLEPPEFDRPTTLDDLLPKREALRTAAEHFAAAWFLARGLPTATPARSSPYDLLVTFPEGIRRVQVKTSTHRGVQGTWIVQVGQRPYALDKKATRQPYDPDLLDYYFVIDGDFVVYLIPSNVVAGRSSISVGRYQAFRVGDASALYN